MLKISYFHMNICFTITINLSFSSLFNFPPSLYTFLSSKFLSAFFHSSPGSGFHIHGVHNSYYGNVTVAI